METITTEEGLTVKNVRVNWEAYAYKSPSLIVTFSSTPEVDIHRPTKFRKTNVLVSPALTYFSDDFAVCTVWAKNGTLNTNNEDVQIPEDGIKKLTQLKDHNTNAQVNFMFNLEGDDRLIPVTYFTKGSGKDRYKVVLCTLRKIRSFKKYLPDYINLLLTKSRREGMDSLHITPSLKKNKVTYPNGREAPKNIEILECL